MLARRLGEAVSQDRLAEALWEEQAARSAANALRTTCFGCGACCSRPTAQIVTDPAGYRLQAPADVVDARLAERWSASGAARWTSSRRAQMEQLESEL